MKRADYGSMDSSAVTVKFEESKFNPGVAERRASAFEPPLTGRRSRTASIAMHGCALAAVSVVSPCTGINHCALHMRSKYYWLKLIAGGQVLSLMSTATGTFTQLLAQK